MLTYLILPDIVLPANCFEKSELFHKKYSKSVPANYRLVSLTSHIVKVFERVLRKKIVNHLEANYTTPAPI